MAKVFDEIDSKLRAWIPLTVEYDDHVGSGAETCAHLRENDRICVMFCAFDGPPRIVRLHGLGELIAHDASRVGGVRGGVRVAIDRIPDACGFGVPQMGSSASGPSETPGSLVTTRRRCASTCNRRTPPRSMAYRPSRRTAVASGRLPGPVPGYHHP